ncbi:RDD family protein [Streptomyces sp. NPDC001700]
MSTDQPPPSGDEPRDRDPFAKQQPPPRANGSPYGDHDGGDDPLAGMPPLAHLGRRLAARILDGLIIGIPIGVIMALILGTYYPMGDGSDARSSVFTLVYVLAYFVYEGLMLTRYGQTLGKKAMKIRVAILETGETPAGGPGWVRAAVYALPEIVPCCGAVFWLVNVLWCTWDRPYRQCLHDKAAKTVVVSVEP